MSRIFVHIGARKGSTGLKNKKTFKYIFKKDRNQMFADYMKFFLSNKKKSKKFDFATLKDGINVTQIIKAMIKSDKTKKFISI